MKIKTLSEYCKDVFGTKVYRLSLSSGCSCPNRDGRLAFGGCSFCSAEGSGEFAANFQDIDLQITQAKEKVSKKFPKYIKEEDKKYIAYFQSFTNTYGDTNRLLGLYKKAMEYEEIVALSIGTRPDCLENDLLQGLSELNKIKPVWLELGLQTIHEETAKRINRCYDLPIFEEAYQKLKAEDIEVIVHVILGLPGESDDDILQTIRYLSTLEPPIDGIKLHGLQILKTTKMAREYEQSPFKVRSLEEYTDLLIECLKILPKNIVIHRMTGDGDKKLLIEPQWSANKRRALNYINQRISQA